ncbi:MAG TPA: transglutaminase domain-containing protein [Chitinophagaceae bacterium]
MKMGGLWRNVLIPVLLIIVYSTAKAGAGKPGDDNIIISSATESYRFDYSKSRNSVEVKQEMVYNYSCLNYRDKAYFSEFFDDQSSLDDVILYENGKKGYVHKDLSGYSVEDIFYSDAKVYRLILDFPKSGWQNEIRLKKTIKDPRYFCTIYFNDAYSVSKKDIVITIPRWLKAEIKEFNFEGYHVVKQTSYSDKEDADIITYTIKNLPERKPEDNMPGPSYFLPHLLVMCKSANVNGQQFTFFNTLQDQYNWYKKIVGMLKNDKTAIKAKVEEITAGIKDDLQKVKTILYWVHENIRYVAFEDGIAGFKPDEAQNVMNKKYGDCKGMANLTRELLVALGFDARLTWIGTNYISYDYSTPALCVDNHMICCLIYKGKKYFLDGTESYLAFENYAERIQGRQVLIENGDTYILERIPGTTADQNLCQFKEKLQVKNNNLTGAIEYVYRGESKEQLLGAIHRTKNEKLNATLERYITNDNKNYTVSNVTVSDINQFDGDLSIKFGLDYAGAVSSFGNEIYIDLDYNKMFNQATIDTAGRKYDYQFHYKYNYKTEVDLEIPAGYKINTLPKDFEYMHADFYFSITCKMNGNTLQYRKQLKILNTLLKKEAFGDWNKAVAGLSEKYLDQLTLIKK